MLKRITWMVVGFTFAASAISQSWMTSYDKGLSAAKKGEWKAARDAFKECVAYRPEDQSKATTMSGPATERLTWRNGAPYSPNFLAAYSGFKVAKADATEASRNELLKVVASELEALLTKGQSSAEAFYFLSIIYSDLADTSARMKLDERLNQASGKLTWKVDTDVLSPEEVANVSLLVKTDIENPGQGNVISAANLNSGAGITSVGGARVPVVANKFALVIGNSQSKLTNLAVPTASDDAQLIREGLIANAGYAETNIDLVLDQNAAGIMAAAKALADRVTEGATVFIFYSGVGVNLDGKDYLAGVDSESMTDSSTMVGKAEIYRMFMAKGARIFAFFQVNRPIEKGRYFGMEVPLVGSIAQCQGTIPGEMTQFLTRNGKNRGLYADAIVGALGEIRTNRIQINEFGWQVYYRMRRGDTGSTGGGSKQTPTLPVLINMASDARF